MIKSRYINIVVAIAVCFSLIAAVLLVVYNDKSTQSNIVSEPEYKSKLFDTDIISVDILADEEEWQQMLDNASNEEYIMVDVVVNGTKFEKVGIRPKGNSSLSQVSQYDNNRYSFRLKFDEYIEGQTCFGLDSFVVNNMLGDNTYMKEYVSYELMKEIGVDCPYYNFAEIKVNGENFGLYLAIELYRDSYETRVSGDTSGMLYNVKSMEMNNKQNENSNKLPDIDNMPSGANMPGRENIPEGFSIPEGGNTPQGGDTPQGGNIPQGSNKPDGFNMTDMPNMSNGNRMGSGGGSLEYTDDNISSYSSIFDNVVGSSGTDKDYEKVIEAIKALNEGNDLEKYFNVDNILRYLAAHTLVVNLDSYSSSMAQNYYIYEKDGKINILPWDYNLSWGGFQSSDASSVINFPIDTPVSGVEMSTRPLIDKLLSNEEYLNKYHEYLQELIDKYFANGKFQEKIEELDALIDDYVKKDTSAFCTYDEYKSSISSFITLGNLRAESVQGQLDGTIPSTTEGQKLNKEALVSSDDLDLSVLGTMGDGKNGGFPNMDGGKNGAFRNMENQNGENSPNMESQNNENFPNMDLNNEKSTQEKSNNKDNNKVPNMNNMQAKSNRNLYYILILFVVLSLAILLVSKLKRKY